MSLPANNERLKPPERRAMNKDEFITNEIARDDAYTAYERECGWYIEEKEELDRAFWYYIEILGRVAERERRLMDMGRDLNESNTA